jgi:serum/glucocorticoid-regulated kinase 2
MDYCSRGDLGDLLKVERKFSEARAKVYMAEMILAIEHLHSLGIIFRDLKPDNILIDEDGHLKLADFGLAKEMEDERTYTFCGTTSYLPPEMLGKLGHGKTLDWYLLGVLLHEMLTGAPPYYNTDK